ncbi:phosphate signaling complex protein PhoU [Tuberibacillus sp. Marseille-P3662]|uniref:phosphate signaling complex protein PhoU n=1 Tax=Tuberibacillus sp. Marseille-P3662 TaxID=1965358 RepID=UPI000A1C8F3E|nr:phosphate signaling complex protein PhoU [Tuberibacillus sp. Marseille-P3662]
MVVRGNFKAELDELKTSLLSLGRLSESAAQQAVEALKGQDIETSLQIIDDDYKINELEEDINDQVILMIAKQQPVASDLRRIMAAVKISTDIERVGDFAVNIAKSTIRIGNSSLIKPLEDIPKMAEIALKMLADGLKAYDEEDVALARTLAETDDKVDKLYGELIQELLELASKQPENMAQITQLAFVCRYIERIADHVTNIAESIIFLVKGKRYELND